MAAGAPGSVENLVIVGSGPAGYTAAIYAARANLSPVVITGFQDGGIPGGQLMTTTHVENFPGFPDGILGPELMDRVKAQAVRWGTRLIEADAEAIDLSQRPFRIQADGQTIQAHAVILATGASANRLGLPSEQRFWNAGISACAICDGATPQFRDVELAVVGGGDSACEEAVYLTKYASRVHLIVRSDKLRASKAMADRVLANPKVQVHWNRQVADCSGGEWLEAIQLKDPATGQSEELPVRGMFYAIGHTPNTRLVREQLSTDGKGYLITQPGRPETSLEGVYAAGDVADAEWRQGITAAGSGCQAALAAERWLTEKDLAVTVSHEPVDPAEVGETKRTAVSDEANFSSDALWQKGSFALRKLYHDSTKPLVVVYTSPTCGPCHVLKPQLKRVLDELGGQAQGIEIDIEAEQEIAQQAGVSGTPTVQVFLNKELKQQFRGVKQRSEFKAAIESLL
ncbi:MAG: thioredoxin-disulfide reductase [Vulcanococcus sp.]|jgi:thioredoxin reductase (NADPH)|uniref:thioredoxin-disulfide reductase n=1 Tax=Synechococcaceae TaxID=1890426 RepID=UPI001FFAE4E2|nr:MULTISPECIES: thioredoxin-disulfide reductase [Synechococcaceae]NCV91250.1 thioredoxin-disulfide reductase [Synechococcaceae bacterium WB7_3xG_012]UPH89929.1 thioredoxin-disulfide reductase [Synechococcus sp. NB0720_010]